MEQKNSTLVRAYVGYDRLDSGIQCAALNALYDQLWLYYNLFQPVDADDRQRGNRWEITAKT